MSIYDSSVDYAKVTESDETDAGCENDNLELAHRGEHELDNTVMTVAINDDHYLEIISNSHQFGPCVKFRGVPWAVYLLLLSAFWLITTIILSQILVEKNSRTAVQNFLLVLRSIGIFTFIGQLSYLIAWKVSFFDTKFLYCTRSKNRFRQEMSQHLKRFVICRILDEIAVRNYVERVSISSNEDHQNSMMNFIESVEFQDIVNDHLNELNRSPEGQLLDMIGVDKSEFSSHCNYVLQQAVCKVFKNFMSQASMEDWRRPESIQHHIEEMISLQLQTLNWKDMMKLAESVSRLQSDRQALIIFVCMTLAGCFIEILRWYDPLN